MAKNKNTNKEVNTNKVVLEKENKKPSLAVVRKVLQAEGSKSGKMKELFIKGLSVKEITDAFKQHGTEVRYNFVYNVVSNYCNISGIEMPKSERAGGEKRKAIMGLYEEGKSAKAISKELKTNTNYVYKVIKDYKAELAKQEVVQEPQSEVK